MLAKNMKRSQDISAEVLAASDMILIKASVNLPVD